MEEALTDERFGRFMERMVFFTPDKTRFMGKVRTPYVSTLYHHLAVAPKAEMRTSTLGIFYMHGLIRPGRMLPGIECPQPRFSQAPWYCPK